MDNPDMDVTKFAAAGSPAAYPSYSLSVRPAVHLPIGSAESIGPGFSPTKESSTDFKVNVGDSAKPAQYAGTVMPWHRFGISSCRFSLMCGAQERQSRCCQSAAEADF